MDYIAALLGTILAIIVSAQLLKRFVKKRKFDSIIDRIPGPPAYPIVGNTLDVLSTPRNERMNFIRKRVAMYKPIFRTWTGPGIADIHVLRPEHVEVIVAGVKNIDKSLGYDFLHPWLGTGLLTSSGEKWHVRRKMITPTFHFKILEDFLEVFGEKSNTLVNLLEKKADGQEFDIYPFITLCALDIICETAMGTQVNAQNESDSDYLQAIYSVSELLLKRRFSPWLLFDFIWKNSEKGKKFSQQVKILHSFTEKVISERKVKRMNRPSNTSQTEDEVMGKKKRMAFLDLLLEASEQGHKLSDSDIREEVDTFMFEGHDTTTAGISWTIFLLGNYPEVQERVFKELYDVFGDSDRIPTMKDLGELKYLEMVIKESLRLYPSVPFIGRKITEEVYLDGYQIPVGAYIQVNIFHLHRCEDQFPEPEKFNPDNFLPEKIQGRHPYAYIPFSAGPRNCIGQKFALLEEKTVLAFIFRKFRIEALEKQEEISLVSELILRPESGVKVRLYPRKSTF